MFRRNLLSIFRLKKRILKLEVNIPPKRLWLSTRLSRPRREQCFSLCFLTEYGKAVFLNQWHAFRWRDLIDSWVWRKNLKIWTYIGYWYKMMTCIKEKIRFSENSWVRRSPSLGYSGRIVTLRMTWGMPPSLMPSWRVQGQLYFFILLFKRKTLFSPLGLRFFLCQNGGCDANSGELISGSKGT